MRLNLVFILTLSITVLEIFVMLVNCLFGEKTENCLDLKTHVMSGPLCCNEKLDLIYLFINSLHKGHVR